MKNISFYNKGYKHKIADCSMSLHEVYLFIKNHPDKAKVKLLRSLKKENDEYSKLKAQLPCVTPHGIFGDSKRICDLIELSDYLYFDIDAESREEMLQIKRSLIEKHGKCIAILGTSVGGRGIFFYIQVNGLTPMNHSIVHTYYIFELFKEYNIDKNAKGIHRSHILPYDADVYYNDNNEVLEIPEHIDYEDYRIACINANRRSDNGYRETVSFYDIKDVFSKIKLKPEIDTGNKLFVVEKAPFVTVFIPRSIKDGTKHRVYRAITQSLMYLNPGIDLLTILSFINFINVSGFATKPMRMKEMLRTVENEYERVIATEEYTIDIKTKSVHIHKHSGLLKEEKIQLASTVNGLLRVRESVRRIADAINELNNKGENVTKAAVSRKANLCKKTVFRHWGKTVEDIDNEINKLNRVVNYPVLDRFTTDSINDEYIYSQAS